MAVITRGPFSKGGRLRKPKGWVASLEMVSQIVYSVLNQFYRSGFSLVSVFFLFLSVIK